MFHFQISSHKNKSHNSAGHDGTKILNEQLIQVPR